MCFYVSSSCVSSEFAFVLFLLACISSNTLKALGFMLYVESLLVSYGLMGILGFVMA